MKAKQLASKLAEATHDPLARSMAVEGQVAQAEAEVHVAHATIPVAGVGHAVHVPVGAEAPTVKKYVAMQEVQVVAVAAVHWAHPVEHAVHVVAADG